MHCTLLQYLNAANGAAKVLAHAELLLRLSRRYEAIAPSGLGHVSRVANYKSGKIIIHADNGAAAAKLRQMSGSLCQHFLKDLPECTGVEIKVQPREIPYQSSPSKPAALSDKAWSRLNETAHSLPSGTPLRAALEQLLLTTRPCEEK